MDSRSRLRYDCTMISKPVLFTQWESLPALVWTHDHQVANEPAIAVCWDHGGTILTTHGAIVTFCLTLDPAHLAEQDSSAFMDHGIPSNRHANAAPKSVDILIRAPLFIETTIWVCSLFLFPDVRLGSNLLQCLCQTLVLGRWQRN